MAKKLEMLWVATLTPYQKAVLKLLTMLWWSVTEAPGVARRESDREYVNQLGDKL